MQYRITVEVSDAQSRKFMDFIKMLAPGFRFIKIEETKAVFPMSDDDSYSSNVTPKYSEQGKAPDDSGETLSEEWRIIE